MGFFGMKRRDDFVDLTEKFRKQEAQASDIRDDASAATTPAAETPKTGFNPFPAFFGGASSTPKATAEEPADDGFVNVSSGLTESGEDKKRKLAKRLMDMTKKIEEFDNKIYHLQQRIEVLERKDSSGIGF